MEKTDTAWNLGGPSIYKDQLDHIKDQSKALFRCKVYITKIYKTFNCDVFYPLEIWNSVIDKFRELDVYDEIPYPLGKKIKDDGNVDISFHVYELRLS